MGGRWGITAPFVGTTLIPPPPPFCINDSNQCMMIRVVAKHPNSDTSESLLVGFISKEVVALQGDPSPSLLIHHVHLPWSLFPKCWQKCLDILTRSMASTCLAIVSLHFVRRAQQLKFRSPTKMGCAPNWAHASGLIDIRQHSQVREGDITPNDKKMDSAHQ